MLTPPRPLGSNTVLDERFWSKVNKDADNGCWEWTAGKFKDRGGYGKYRMDSGAGYAHRLAYEDEHGPIPDGLLIRHLCDNPPCVNPQHLLLGTSQDNSNDKLSRWRHRYGESHQSAKLTDADVKEMRRLYTETQMLCTDIASRFNVTGRTVSSIVNGQGWNHLPYTPTATPRPKSRTALSTDVAVEILRRHKAEGISGRQLARLYGAAPRTVHSLLSGRTYKFIDREKI